MKRKRNKMSVENKAYMRGMQELRHSNASGKHLDKRFKRSRTRGAKLAKAIRDQLD